MSQKISTRELIECGAQMRGNMLRQIMGEISTTTLLEQTHLLKGKPEFDELRIILTRLHALATLYNVNGGGWDEESP